LANKVSSRYLSVLAASIPECWRRAYSAGIGPVGVCCTQIRTRRTTCATRACSPSTTRSATSSAPTCGTPRTLFRCDVVGCDLARRGVRRGADTRNAKNPISEDCLYLNVWTPDVSKVDDEQAAPPTALKAVMVYESIICQPHSIESIYLHSDYSTSSALQCLSPDLPLTLSILTVTPNVNLRGRIRDNWEQMTGPV